MSERQMTDGVGQWKSDMPFPKDMYSFHCVEEEFGISKGKGNPMITRKWELVSPEVVAVGDKKVGVAGLFVTQYLVTKVHQRDDNDNALPDWDTEASDKCFGALAEDYRRLGYDGSSIDDENPKLIAKGLTADFICFGKQDKKYKSPTPEQLQQGKKVGDPIKDANGKEIAFYQLNFDGGVQGLSAKQLSSAF